MTDIVPALVPLTGTPRKPLAPLLKLTPRHNAIAAEVDTLKKQVEPSTDDIVGADDNLTEALTSDTVAEETANGSVVGVSLPPIDGSTALVAKGAIIGDQQHLFWRSNLEVHIRVWELQQPACYAVQTHATEDKRDLGVTYLNKDAVDAALNGKYILNGGGGRVDAPRFTMQISDLKDGADQAVNSDNARLERHYEEVMKLVISNIVIQGETADHHKVCLAAKGGQSSPFAYVADTGEGHPAMAALAPRSFEVKSSRAQAIEDFQRIQAQFSAQLKTVKSSTGAAQTSSDDAKEIHGAAMSMTSPVRLDAILKRVRKKTMTKMKALSAFGITRTTL